MNKKGVSLVEIGSVILLIALVALVLVPVIASTLDQRTVQCQSNLNAIGRAVKMYLSDWEDVFSHQQDI